MPLPSSSLRLSPVVPALTCEAIDLQQLQSWHVSPGCQGGDYRIVSKLGILTHKWQGGGFHRKTASNPKEAENMLENGQHSSTIINVSDVWSQNCSKEPSGEASQHPIEAQWAIHPHSASLALNSLELCLCKTNTGRVKAVPWSANQRANSNRTGQENIKLFTFDWQFEGISPYLSIEPVW